MAFCKWLKLNTSTFGQKANLNNEYIWMCNVYTNFTISNCEKQLKMVQIRRKTQNSIKQARNEGSCWLLLMQNANWESANILVQQCTPYWIVRYRSVDGMSKHWKCFVNEFKTYGHGQCLRILKLTLFGILNEDTKNEKRIKN